MKKAYKKILSMMYNNPNDLISAVDFVNPGKYFIGYEASARLSELRHHEKIGKYFINDRKKNGMMYSKLDWEIMRKEDEELYTSIIKQINQLTIQPNDRIQEGGFKKSVFGRGIRWFSR